MTALAMPVLLLLPLLASVCGEHIRELEVSEGAPVGTRIGFIGDGIPRESGPPYLIVGSDVESDLSINQDTGEIRTRNALDRETRSSYSFVAISRDNVRVLVKVLDENDNAPVFPTRVMSIEFPENTPRDFKRTLHPAKDLDLGGYNTQSYNIVSGNVNNAFRLSSHRERDGVLYLDLQINGFLDREATSAYSLVIQALDGGEPPLRGEMTVNITIQDVNDNQPIFNQSRYYATVPENATVGTTVLQVFASDDDAGTNGHVEYSINRRQSDRDNMFRIDPISGMIAVNKPLDFELKELHELVIVAKDQGLQPLETTAFVSIRVTDVNDNQPTINVIFLSDDATPKISESAQPGEFVARISVHDPDSKTEYSSNINVTLDGGDGHFNLTTQNNVIYLVVVSLPLDRELQPNYTLNVVATDTGTPPLHASKTINLLVTDINDNAPEFDAPEYRTNVMEVSDPGTSVIQITATDKDEGNNSAITYSLVHTPETHSGWFQIDARSGLVTTREVVDCETDPVPRLTVVATDNGFPPLSSSTMVAVTIHDVNDNEPIFDQSFYNVTVAENESEGRCILKVSATDPDCGVNAMVNYTLGDGFGKQTEFTVRSDTGEICIKSRLDYEERNVYELPVIATDRGGLSTTAMVKIQVTDTNDNRPTFYPREYNVSLREGSSTPNAPVVVVAATDPDSGRFGAVAYRIVAGNDAGLFRVDKNSGEIFLGRSGLLSSRTRPYHRLNVSATDGGGLRAEADAEVFISVIDSTQRPPIFEHSRYTFSIREDVRRNTVIGAVKAAVREFGLSNPIRYSIYSGDPEGLFRIDPITGFLQTALELDHEQKSNVLLNILATSGDPPVYGHSQVNVDIEDVNDNAPEFDSKIVRISVPENVETDALLYAAHARDPDSGANGLVRYKISGSGAFAIDPKLGHLTLRSRLDYESSQRHTLVVTATDSGRPPLSANLTVAVEVQDVNDNPPVFERAEYSIKVLETMPINSQIVQVVAVDLDTGNNARLTYRLVSVNNSKNIERSDVFGIFPNSGWVYLRSNLDRETDDRYTLTVAATDNGTPSETATARVTVSVSDANDNDPVFARDAYEFAVEENQRRGALVGVVAAADRDAGLNAAVRYSLAPGNASFHIDAISGEITTKKPLDREQSDAYDLVAEARDQGTPSRSARVPVKIRVLDVNDNAPEIVDPQEDVVSVREEQSPGTEVVRVRAIDADSGHNASLTYAILKGKDSDGYGVFSIDPVTGVIRTRMVLDHEEKTIYRLAVAATDGGKPAKQTVRVLRVEVLDLNDNRPTFTSSSLVFKVLENVAIGHVVGSVATASDYPQENSLTGTGGHITYTLTSLMSDAIRDAFDIDRNSGSLVVARELDREVQSEYRLEVRALDTSAANNPQSSAVTVRVDVADVNDNPPRWPEDPVTVEVREDAEVGVGVRNFSASDADAGANGDLRYSLVRQFPNGNQFSVDSLTGTLILASPLDYEALKEHTVVIKATDQSLNVSERLSTSLSVRVLVTDYNDNAPKFVVPSTPNVFVSENAIVGMPLVHLVAVDKDANDNGRVTYVISSGNELGLFALGYETGYLTLTKTLAETSRVFTLNVTASDHGSPTRQASTELRLSVRASSENPPRFLNEYYKAAVAEDAAVGAFVVKVTAKSGVFEQSGNLTFHIPSGIADDAFEINPKTGTVTTKKPLDRELLETYALPIYVLEYKPATAKSLFDVATLLISVTDVNDHAPQFAAGSCYPLSIPENNEKSIVHTFAATDPDAGKNSEVSYSITGGNFENKFTINQETGELTAAVLDRESRPRYHLTVSAHDKGAPVLRGVCNVTVLVEDQNDNDPKFDLSRYTATIAEDLPGDTSVLKVHATDADVGINSRLVYSLANESQWLFRIDNKTGVLTTAGAFDRESRSTYSFMVVATDGGKYNARSQKVPVVVHVSDVNDNKPIFTHYPFVATIPPYVPAGQTVLKVTAKDADQGMNSEVVYSLPNDGIHSKFRVNPNTGIITISQSLASENGRVIYLNVIATDKGNPPQNSTGLVEILVGDVSETSPHLHFKNSTYNVFLPENTEEHHNVVQVTAVRNDGRKQRIYYSIGTGNEENVFAIHSETGTIQVRDSKNLDYELHNTIRLVVEARTESPTVRHGYCEVLINLVDQNDNAPKFTQQQYSASVWEGRNKGTFVLQVVASDADEEKNSRVLYHIVDGNHDNAFLIEPAFSGIIKTNIVLDREIRDKYRLTVIATDEGVPQMTGTTRISINVVDVNDNQPTFPPSKLITVNESAEVGTVVATITANDVDTNPTLTYGFSKEHAGLEGLGFFGIDRFSGKIILKKRLDFEVQQEYQLYIVASDTEHLAQTVLNIKVADVNDNAPVFSQPAYHATLPDSRTSSYVDLLTVNATDADVGDNARIKYTLATPANGFVIDEEGGILRVNLSSISIAASEDIELLVTATDRGVPERSSVAAVRVQLTSGIGRNSPAKKNDYRLQIAEDTPKGTTLMQTGSLTNNKRQSFVISEGNDDGTFEISNPTGALILVKSLDRELKDSYKLKISTGDGIFSVNYTAVNVFIAVDDVNDNAPVFDHPHYEETIGENTPVGTSIKRVAATDADLAANSQIVYDITSGNDRDLFKIHPQTGAVTVHKNLDYDHGADAHRLLISACDAGVPALCTLASLHVNVQDENDNEPRFPFAEYLEYVGENEPLGTAIFSAHATDADRGVFGRLNYSIVNSTGGVYGSVDDSWRFFQVDSSTGLLSTNAVFDYEQRSRYAFLLLATDSGGRAASVKVRVEVESRDEFHPQFSEKTYRFVIATPARGSLPVGYVVGHVSATDRDKGPDGRVVYQLTAQNPYFKINRTTGAIVIKRKFFNSEMLELGKEISLIVTASTGRQGSLTNSTVVEITLDPLGDPGTNVVINENSATVAAENNGIADWALGLLIALILLLIMFAAIFAFLHLRNKRNKNINKPNLNGESVPTSNNYVDPSAFDTIPIRGASGVVTSGQFGPPKYDEIPPYGPGHAASSNSGAATTSELSASDQSGSSGRGSAEDGEEDGEDEEIRMINEGPLQRSDEDNLSDVSVRNTQEYLARLGIVNNAPQQTVPRICSNPRAGSSKETLHSHHQTVPLDSLHIYDEEGATENDITNLIYAKLNDVAGSDRASSTDENGAVTSTTLANVMAIGGYNEVSAVTHQPSMNGSLSSIVHSEEELAGSYNWDYLLDWGPQYQPLAHVFSEIARLKDDTASVQSAASGNSSVKSKSSAATKSVPPPLITSVAPRSIAAPVLNARGGGGMSSHNQMMMLPRSPISHDASGATFSTSAAMSPSFSPSLSPLATKSPSISPLVTPGLPTAHHVMPRQRNKALVETELRI